jgi:glutamate/aspartate transport system substrate-binding protein
LPGKSGSSAELTRHAPRLVLGERLVDGAALRLYPAGLARRSTATGAGMQGNLFKRRGMRMFLRLAAASCALFVSVAAVSAETNVSADSRLKSIIAKNVIRIAYRTDARPFAFVNDAKEPLGYTVDLCKRVTKSIEQQFGVHDLKVEWVPVTVESRFSAVASGKADMECGSSTVTLGRMKQVDFSIFVFVESTGVLVSGASNIHSFAELAGKKIAVVSGTTNERAVTEQVRLQNLKTTLVTVKDRDEGIALLEGGKVDAVAGDKLLLAGAQLKHPETFAMLPEDLSIEQYAITLPRGDWAFRLAVNTGLAQIFRSGRITEVFKNWFFGLRPGILLNAVYGLGQISD